MIRKIVLPALILLMSIFYIFWAPSEPLTVKLLFKVIPMVLIITYGWLHLAAGRTRTQYILLTGLLFCMLGDALLVWWFVPGLLAFLIGHIFYLAAFLRCWRFSWLRMAALLPVIAYGVIIGTQVTSAMKLAANTTLIAPVLLYLTVISLMAWSAIMTGSRMAAIGSILFVISDSILAWNKFVADVPSSGVYIMTTYYAAQFLIASSMGVIDRDRSSRLSTPTLTVNK